MFVHQIDPSLQHLPRQLRLDLLDDQGTDNVAPHASLAGFTPRRQNVSLDFAFRLTDWQNSNRPPMRQIDVVLDGFLDLRGQVFH